MQTILLFGGNQFYPKGGARDLLGVVPYLSPKLVFEVMCEVIEKEYDNAQGTYWCNAAVVNEGAVHKHVHWRLQAGSDIPEQDLASALYRTAPDKPLTVCMTEVLDAFDVE